MNNLESIERVRRSLAVREAQVKTSALKTSYSVVYLPSGWHETPGEFVVKDSRNIKINEKVVTKIEVEE